MQLWSYFINTAVMTGLQRNCFYHYSVGNGDYWSEVFEFSGRTPEVEEPFEDNKNGIHTWIYGDLGIGENGEGSKKMLENISFIGEHDVILHMGDIAYNMDDYQGLVGDMFLKEVQSIAARFPYMVLIGNHDLYGNMTQFINRFSMPKNADNEGTSLFYSFNLGPVHFIMLNTVYPGSTSHAEMMQTQYNWLVKDLELAQKRRKEFPWIFVLGHYAMYCTPDWTDPDVYHNYDECFTQGGNVKNYMEDLLYDCLLCTSDAADE